MPTLPATPTARRAARRPAGARVLLRALALPLLVVLAGCNGSSTQLPVITTQRGIWQSKGIKSYSYVSTYACECPPNYTAALRTTVTNNVVSAIVVESSGAAVPLSYRTTIDGLFNLIDTEQRARPGLLEVTYDPTIGYPTRIKYGNIDVDGGGIITVTSFQAAP